MKFQRKNIPELEDVSWLPAFYRDLMTDFLQFVVTKLKLYHPALSILKRLVPTLETPYILDCGSGATGPLLALVPALQRDFPQISVLFSDLYPNSFAAARIEELRQRSSMPVEYLPYPVDMASPPASFGGLQVMFTSFHHLSGESAEKLISQAVKEQRCIAVFEVTGRTVLHFLMVFFVPLGVWFLTPFIPKRRFLRLVFTYIIPIVPLGCLWDGLASNIRTFSRDDVEAIFGKCWQAHGGKIGSLHFENSGLMSAWYYLPEASKTLYNGTAERGSA